MHSFLSLVSMSDVCFCLLVCETGSGGFGAMAGRIAGCEGEVVSYGCEEPGKCLTDRRVGLQDNKQMGACCCSFSYDMAQGTCSSGK
ncbi:hypothetical protein BC567DRAFT_94873 [Phyllosticta citribraziliensis]